MTVRSRTGRLAAALTTTVAVLAASAVGAAPAGADAAPAWDPDSGYTSTDAGDGTYTVPLLRSDVPDVSVERLPAAESGEGRDVYYMISTTMHLSPGAPIMKSYDLVNWEIVNYVFDRLGPGDAFSLRNGQNSYGQGQWASSLRYHEGTWYVAFNTNNLGGSYIYRTDDIEDGTWERTPLGRAFHDPSLFFDVDGTPYVFYGSGSTSAVRLDEDLTTVLEEYPQIIRPADYPGSDFLGGLFEGAQVQYIDGHYYVVIITWPPGQGRQVVLFRSEELLGRYATADGSNPYEARGVLDSDGFAQGSLVPVAAEDGGTDWWGMFFRDSFPVGRIPALIPATWSDGWPTFGDDGVVRVGDSFDTPITLEPDEVRRERLHSLVVSDDFANDAPHRPWMDEQWEVPEPPELDESLLGVELVSNGGFEDGTTGWVVNGTGELTTTTEAASGEAAALVTGRTTTGAGPLQDLSGRVQHDVTYRVSARVRYDDPASPSTKQFLVTAHYGGGSYTNLASATVPRGQWGTVRGTFTVPASQPLDTVRLFVETPWTADPGADPALHLMDLRVDDVSLVGEATATDLPHPDELAPNGSRLDARWQWNHAPDNRYWSLTEREGWLRLTNGRVVTGDYEHTKLGDDPDLTWFEEARNTLSQRTVGPRQSAETALDVSGMRDGDVAGLAAYNRGFSYVAVKQVDGERVLGVVNRTQPFAVDVDHAAVEAFVPGTTVALGDADVVHLKADLDFAQPVGQLWTTFSYSLDGRQWQQLGQRVGPQTLDGTLAHFMGHRLGLFSYATEQTGGHVDFDHFLLSDVLGTDGQPVDTSDLDAAIAHAEGLVAAEYPAGTWEDVQQALVAARAARSSDPATQNQADAPERALSVALAEAALVREPVAPPALDVDVQVETRCVGRRVVLVVRVTNGEDVPVTVRTSSEHGERTRPVLAPGRGSSWVLPVRAADVAAGEVDVVAEATVDGEQVTATYEAGYEARSCA
ncbi:family 43 glycosylhydrolase [Aquipuribacter sp. SD81]|uniref:beta-xylosidase family glycoside hydrolase n=1 Tax=Aquipuribacter sp. SD81 TaxID=3127703 RepID=UPI003019DE67